MQNAQGKRFIGNPLTGPNTVGMIVVGLSLCLVATENPGGFWLERHKLFCLALSVGLVLTALYRRVIVTPNAIETITGVWPLKLRRVEAVSAMNEVAIDACRAKGGTTYEVRIGWTDNTGATQSMLFWKGGYDFIDQGCQMAEALGLVISLGPSFRTDSGEIARKIVDEHRAKIEVPALEQST